MLMHIPLTLAPARLHLNPLQMCAEQRYRDWPGEDAQFVFMAPKTFLALAEGDFTPSPARLERVRHCLLRGEGLSALPWLEVGTRGQAGICTAHDGRHRAQAASELQLPLLPVALRPAPGSDSLRGLHTLWGQVHTGSAPTQVRVSRPMTLQEVLCDYHSWSVPARPHVEEQ